MVRNAVAREASTASWVHLGPRRGRMYSERLYLGPAHPPSTPERQRRTQTPALNPSSKGLLAHPRADGATTHSAAALFLSCLSLSHSALSLSCLSLSLSLSLSHSPVSELPLSLSLSLALSPVSELPLSLSQHGPGCHALAARTHVAAHAARARRRRRPGLRHRGRRGQPAGELSPRPVPPG
jgi:hypothetical protein